jgi:hypothetical protein
MSAHAALRRFTCSLAFAPFLLAMHGCSGSPVESSKALASKASLEPIESDVAPNPITQVPANDLQGLAQRDVDDFLRLKREATEAAPTAQPEFIEPTTTAEAEAAALPVTPPAIIWTDPVGKALAEAPAVDAAGPPVDETAITMGEAALDDISPNDVLAIPQPSLQSDSPQERLNELLVGLSAELYMRASDADQPLRELIMISATSMVDPSRKLANIEALPGLTEREREVLAAFQGFFLKLGEKLDGSEEADAAIMSALQTLQTDIVKAPTLTIPAAALCTSVGGFSKYEPFSANRFLAHAGQQLVVYVEIDDFKCTQGQTGQWVTELAQQLVIYSDRDGIPVWREEWLPVVDTATKPRQDFYTTQLITLPNALSVGKYQLKIRLRDEQSGAEAEQSIEFEMVADAKLAAGR